MKKLFILLSFVLLSLFSCETKTTQHEIRKSENGKDSVVYVQYQDPNTHQWLTYYMEYRLFMMLYSQGGYNSCYGYYQSHPSEFSYSNPTYRNYQTSYKSYSSPSRSSSSSISKSNSSTATKSYSSPSRSTTSSPSRSYSSPSRSTSSFHSSSHR